jgi:NADPH:quinone reductase-like Zn-dependent oxidoreductase
LPGAIRVTQTSTFDEIVGQPLPNADKVFAFFDQLAVKDMIPGLAGESIQTIEKRLGPLPEGFAEAEAAAITASIFRVLRS